MGGNGIVRERPQDMQVRTCSNARSDLGYGRGNGCDLKSQVIAIIARRSWGAVQMSRLTRLRCHRWN